MVHVLYVDDEECLLDICQIFLGQMGKITVDTARCVDDGLDLIERTEYDAIISDYEMPFKNGLEFLKTVRARGCRTPFIIFTGRGREEVMMEAFNSGADFYLQKGGEMKSQFAELIHKVSIAIERRRGERALETSNSLLRATLESTADGIMAIDSSGAISVCNQKFLQMWNLAEGSDYVRTEEAFILYARDQVEDFAAFEKPIRESRADPDSASYDLVRCRDGRTFRRVSQAQRIGSRIVGRVWSYRDIAGQSVASPAFIPQDSPDAGILAGKKIPPQGSARVTSQKKQGSEKYRDIFVEAACPMLIVDRHSLEILDLNRAAEHIYGYGRDELCSLALPHLSLDSGAHVPEFSDQPPETWIRIHRRKDGSEFPVDLRISFVTLAGRECMTVAVRDLSGTHLREDALRLSNTKLSLLSMITRHDIINKLTALSGYSELLAARMQDPQSIDILQKQRETLDFIWKQIDFTKEYDCLGVKPAEWDRVDRIAKRACGQVSLPVPFECETGCFEIFADPLAEKVFYNLFDNALRYGRGISRIRLSCERDGKDLRIVFEDNGTGIAPDDKERIFLRGYGRNTGLGLFLSREILSLTGITIRETGEYRKGARFEIRVPAGNFRVAEVLSPPQDFSSRLSAIADQ